MVPVRFSQIFWTFFLHLVLVLQLFTSNKSSVDNHGEQLSCMYLACKNTRNGSKACCLLIERKNKRQSEARTAVTVWNWSGMTISPGVLQPLKSFVAPKGGNFIYPMMHRFILYYQASERTWCYQFNKDVTVEQQCKATCSADKTFCTFAVSIYLRFSFYYSKYISC